MICEICQKNEATIHIDESFDKAFVRERHLCKHCASKVDLFSENELFSMDLKNVFADKNDDFFENYLSTGNLDSINVIQCEHCSKTLNEFLKDKEVGCPSCYAKFSANVLFYMKSTMKARRHLGKKPNQDMEIVVKNQKRFELEKKLVNLISNEDYENAAIIRDYISILK